MDEKFVFIRRRKKKKGKHSVLTSADHLAHVARELAAPVTKEHERVHVGLASLAAHRSLVAKIDQGNWGLTRVELCQWLNDDADGNLDNL